MLQFGDFLLGGFLLGVADFAEAGDGLGGFEDVEPQ